MARKGPAGALLINSIDTMKSMGMDTSQAETYAGLVAADPEAALKYADEEMLPLIRAKHSEIFPEEERIPNSELAKDPATGRLGTVTQSRWFSASRGCGVCSDKYQQRNSPDYQRGRLNYSGHLAMVKAISLTTKTIQ